MSTFNNGEPHTWGLAFAVSLVNDAGFIVKGETRAFPHITVKRSHTDPEPLRVKVHSRARVASEDLRDLLDNPVMLGGMRVRSPKPERKISLSADDLRTMGY